MNRLRGERVIVELEDKEKKEAYEQTTGGLIVPTKPDREFALVRGTIVKVGHLVNTNDLKEGMTAYVKKHQGERLSPDTLQYLYRADDIVAND